MTPRQASRDLTALAIGAGAIGALTVVYVRGLHLADATTAALSYLMVVLLVAAASSLWVAIATTCAASLALDFFFFPPVGTFNISDREDWIAFSAFVAASLVASRLSLLARQRHAEALRHRDALGHLFDLSRDVLLVADGADALGAIVERIKTRFGLDYVAVDVHLRDQAHRHEVGAQGAALPVASTSLPLRAASGERGTLSVGGRTIESVALEGLASVVAIAVERSQLLEERREAELAQRSIELRATLMASLAHDLGTPLTTIRLALGNLGSGELDATARGSQVGVGLAAVDRLARLFRNMLEMTRLDAGHVAPDPQWVSPGELVEAARTQVAYSIGAHVIEVAEDTPSRFVLVDARLTSAALAHVLENAAHYSPPGSTIFITHRCTADGLELSVRDEGPGFAASDREHLFERFYRGRAATQHASGSGMGLSIARALVAAQGGRIWVENRTERGAEVFIVVPTVAPALDEPEEEA